MIQVSNPTIRNRFLGLFGLATIACLLFFKVFIRNDDLVYHDKHINTWIRELYEGPHGKPPAPPESEPRIALSHFGESAVSHLIREFEGKKDPLLARKLRPYLAKIKPISIETRIIEMFNWSFEPPYISRQRAMEGFMCLGPKAKSVVPRLSYHLNYTKLRNRAAIALGFIGPDSVPTLLRSLSHQDPSIRTAAAMGLQLVSPAADQLVSVFLGNLEIPFNPSNSWTNRSIIRLTAENLERDSYRYPPYRELGPVIKSVPLEKIESAAEMALTGFDAQLLQSQSSQRSTRAFHHLMAAVAPYVRGSMKTHQTNKILRTIEQAAEDHPSRIYSIKLLKLDVLLTQERLSEAEPSIRFLLREVENSWIRSSDLAEVLIWGTRMDLPRHYAIQAADQAYALAKPKDFHTIKLCIDAYGNRSQNPRKAELELELRNLRSVNPFYIPQPK